MADAETKTGEAKPIDEAKVLSLIKQMVPATSKATTLQDGVTHLLSEFDKLRRQAAEVKTPAGDVGSAAQILEGIGRLEKSLQQLKEQFSIMRQYGVGAAAK